MARKLNHGEEEGLLDEYRNIRAACRTTDRWQMTMKEGYLVIRDAIPNTDLVRFDAAIDCHLPHDAYAPGKSYPEPAKYTLSQQVLSDPELARVAEHPVVVDAVEQLLQTPAHLTAYVIYVRTPGDQGSIPITTTNAGVPLVVQWIGCLRSFR